MLNGGELRGVITDWGGVLTPPIQTTERASIEADGIDWEAYVAEMRPWEFTAIGEVPPAVTAQSAVAGVMDAASNPVHALERGECSAEEFEKILAAQLLTTDGRPVVAEGLLKRMFAASVPVPAMYGMIRKLRGAGYSTALLSNSWGADEYPRADFPGLFDTVVISGEVGMRKPEPEIFRHAAATLGLEPGECVFIDDVEKNIAAAVACGMIGVHHTDPAATAAALTEILGITLG